LDCIGRKPISFSSHFLLGKDITMVLLWYAILILVIILGLGISVYLYRRREAFNVEEDDANLYLPLTIFPLSNPLLLSSSSTPSPYSNRMSKRKGESCEVVDECESLACSSSLDNEAKTCL
jgi:hypothetical protein